MFHELCHVLFTVLLHLKTNQLVAANEKQKMPQSSVKRVVLNVFLVTCLAEK